ncbi:hypothetical protein V8E53_004046 [Lactarius tabidus]
MLRAVHLNYRAKGRERPPRPLPCGHISKARRCMTTGGSQALTWVCVIDFNPTLNTVFKKNAGTVVYEQLLEPLSKITGYLTHSTILLGHSVESDDAGTANFTSKLLSCIIQDRRPTGHDPEEYARVHGSSQVYGLSQADYVPIVTRIAPAGMATIDHDNLGPWNGTSATGPTKTVARGSAQRRQPVVAEKAENQTRVGETKTENSEVVTNLDALLTSLHAAFPSFRTLLLFLGLGDPQSMSTLTARLAECQARHQEWLSGG